MKFLHLFSFKIQRFHWRSKARGCSGALSTHHTHKHIYFLWITIYFYQKAFVTSHYWWCQCQLWLLWKVFRTLRVQRNHILKSIMYLVLLLAVRGSDCCSGDPWSCIELVCVTGMIALYNSWWDSFVYWDLIGIVDPRIALLALSYCLLPYCFLGLGLLMGCLRP